MMNLIFVHGWSVTSTSTYGDLPQSLADQAASVGISLNIKHVHLGKYVSFHDDVTADDIARGLQRALVDTLGKNQQIQPFSCITHSTGGPVVREWIDRFYGKDHLNQLPLKHLVMLAPANHGSALAKIGKARVGRIKAMFSGTEPGQRVLDWLCLGSNDQWQLNIHSLAYDNAGNGFYPFVLTGQGIDTSFYDFLNSYLVEPGSDGVVRVSGANMNYRFLALKQTDTRVDSNDRREVYALAADPAQPVRRPPETPLGVFHQFSHSGSKMGILASSRKKPDHQLICNEVLQCLKVDSPQDYSQRQQQLATTTAAEQTLTPKGKDEPISRYCMLVIRVRDERGEIVKQGDFDILLLAGSKYREADLPKGFSVDSQFNDNSHNLVFYLDYDRMVQIKDGCFGLRVVVRPESGFSYYRRGEFQSAGIPITDVFAANETTYVDILMQRRVDKNVFRFDRADQPSGSFKKVKPSGDTF